MSAPEPPYAYVRAALTECVEELGFIEPLILACIAVNGSVVVLRTEGENVEDLASHTEGAGFTLPISIMVIDARGKVIPVLITNDGMERLN